MKLVRDVLVCVLLAVLVVAVVYGILFVRAATVVVAAVPGEVAATRTALIGEVRQTREDLNWQILFVREELTGQLSRVLDGDPGAKNPMDRTPLRGALIGEIQAARKELLDPKTGQMTALRMDVMAEVRAIHSDSNKRFGDTLARADTALGKIEELRSDLKPVLDHAGNLAKQVDDTAPMFLNCEYNPDCIFNRYVGASKGIERAALNFGQMTTDFRGALPKALATWQDIGIQVDGTAANVRKLTTPKWYDRALGYGYTGIQIYRDLNPVTNIISSFQQWKATRQ
jgi:hypothetical protein